MSLIAKENLNRSCNFIGEKIVQLLSESGWIWADFTVHTKSGSTVKFIPHKEPISWNCNFVYLISEPGLFSLSWPFQEKILEACVKYYRFP